jgi:uncharacterized protein YndB with AHSA1/START domain
MQATYETIDSRPALRFERRFSHPIEAVWRAITEPDELAHWFPSAVAVDLRVGGEMTFTFQEVKLSDQPMTLSGSVTDLDPPRLFAFFWGGDHLRFELSPVAGSGTDLRFTVLIDDRDKAARDGAGWHVCLDRLAQFLGGAPAKAPGAGATSEWRSHYDDYVQRGWPAGAEIPG